MSFKFTQEHAALSDQIAMQQHSERTGYDYGSSNYTFLRNYAESQAQFEDFAQTGRPLGKLIPRVGTITLNGLQAEISQADIDAYSAAHPQNVVTGQTRIKYVEMLQAGNSPTTSNSSPSTEQDETKGAAIRIRVIEINTGKFIKKEGFKTNEEYQKWVEESPVQAISASQTEGFDYDVTFPIQLDQEEATAEGAASPPATVTPSYPPEPSALTHKVSEISTHVRTEPSSTASIIDSLLLETEVTVYDESVGKNGDWAKVSRVYRGSSEIGVGYILSSELERKEGIIPAPINSEDDKSFRKSEISQIWTSKSDGIPYYDSSDAKYKVSITTDKKDVNVGIQKIYEEFLPKGVGLILDQEGKENTEEIINSLINTESYDNIARAEEFFLEPRSSSFVKILVTVPHKHLSLLEDKDLDKDNFYTYHEYDLEKFRENISKIIKKIDKVGTSVKRFKGEVKEFDSKEESLRMSMLYDNFRNLLKSNDVKFAPEHKGEILAIGWDRTDKVIFVSHTDPESNEIIATKEYLSLNAKTEMSSRRTQFLLQNMKELVSEGIGLPWKEFLETHVGFDKVTIVPKADPPKNSKSSEAEGPTAMTRAQFLAEEKFYLNKERRIEKIKERIKQRDFVGSVSKQDNYKKLKKELNSPLEDIYENVLSRIDLKSLLVSALQCAPMHGQLDILNLPDLIKDIDKIIDEAKKLFHELPTMFFDVDFPTDDISASFVKDLKNFITDMITALIASLVQSVFSSLIDFCPDVSGNEDSPMDPERLDLSALQAALDDMLGDGIRENIDVDSMMNFIEDLASMLSLQEYCDLVSGNPSDKALDIVMNLIRVEYCHLGLDTKAKVIEFFKLLAGTGKFDICDELNEILPPPSSLSPNEDPCEPDNLRRRILINKGMSDEQVQEQIRRERERTAKLARQLMDAMAGQPFQAPNLFCQKDAEGNIIPGATPFMDETFSVMMRETVESLFGPVYTTFQSDGQSYSDSLMEEVDATRIVITGYEKDDDDNPVLTKPIKTTVDIKEKVPVSSLKSSHDSYQINESSEIKIPLSSPSAEASEISAILQKNKDDKEGILTEAETIVESAQHMYDSVSESALNNARELVRWNNSQVKFAKEAVEQAIKDVKAENITNEGLNKVREDTGQEGGFIVYKTPQDSPQVKAAEAKLSDAEQKEQEAIGALERAERALIEDRERLLRELSEAKSSRDEAQSDYDTAAESTERIKQLESNLAELNKFAIYKELTPREVAEREEAERQLHRDRQLLAEQLLSPPPSIGLPKEAEYVPLEEEGCVPEFSPMPSPTQGLKGIFQDRPPAPEETTAEPSQPLYSTAPPPPFLDDTPSVYDVDVRPVTGQSMLIGGKEYFTKRRVPEDIMQFMSTSTMEERYSGVSFFTQLLKDSYPQGFNDEQKKIIPIIYKDLKHEIIENLFRIVAKGKYFETYEGTDALGYFVELINLGPAVTDTCDPHLLKLKKLVDEVLEEFQDDFCLDMEAEKSNGEIRKTPLEASMMKACVKATLRAYLIDNLSRGIFTTAAFAETDSLLNYKMLYIIDRISDELRQYGEDYYMLFMKEVSELDKDRAPGETVTNSFARLLKGEYNEVSRGFLEAIFIDSSQQASIKEKLFLSLPSLTMSENKLHIDIGETEKDLIIPSRDYNDRKTLQNNLVWTHQYKIEDKYYSREDAEELQNTSQKKIEGIKTSLCCLIEPAAADMFLLPNHNTPLSTGVNGMWRNVAPVFDQIGTQDLSRNVYILPITSYGWNVENKSGEDLEIRSIRKMMNTIKMRTLFDWAFPLEDYQSLISLHEMAQLSTIQKVNTVFGESRDELHSLFFSVLPESDDWKKNPNALNNVGGMDNLTAIFDYNFGLKGVPCTNLKWNMGLGVEWGNPFKGLSLTFALKAILNTSLMLFKGHVERMDPNVILANRLSFLSSLVCLNIPPTAYSTLLMIPWPGNPYMPNQLNVLYNALGLGLFDASKQAESTDKKKVKKALENNGFAMPEYCDVREEQEEQATTAYSEDTLPSYE